MQTPPLPQQSQSDRVYPIIHQPHRSHPQRSILIGAGVCVALAIGVTLIAVFVFGVGQSAPARATQAATALTTPLPTVVVPATPGANATPGWRAFFKWSAGESSTSGRFYIPSKAKARIVWSCTASGNLSSGSCIVELTRYLSVSTTGATQLITVANAQGNAHGSYTFASDGVYTVHVIIGIGDSGDPSENFGAQVQIYQ